MQPTEPLTTPPTVSPPPFLPHPWMFFPPLSAYVPFWNPPVDPVTLLDQVLRPSSIQQAKDYLDFPIPFVPNIQRLSEDLQLWFRASGLNKEQFARNILNHPPTCLDGILTRRSFWTCLKPEGQRVFTRIYNWLRLDRNVQIYMLNLLETPALTPDGVPTIDIPAVIQVFQKN
uniref:CUT domain-containing protein n=1 Tax=Caenorhabditis tropicalis TaxID=1561998 RepID=A0A1I7V0P3_9PELO